MRRGQGVIRRSKASFEPLPAQPRSSYPTSGRADSVRCWRAAAAATPRGRTSPPPTTPARIGARLASTPSYPPPPFPLLPPLPPLPLWIVHWHRRLEPTLFQLSRCVGGCSLSGRLSCPLLFPLRLRPGSTVAPRALLVVAAQHRRSLEIHAEESALQSMRWRGGGRESKRAYRMGLRQGVGVSQRVLACHVYLGSVDCMTQAHSSTTA